MDYGGEQGVNEYDFGANDYGMYGYENDEDMYGYENDYYDDGFEGDYGDEDYLILNG